MIWVGDQFLSPHSNAPGLLGQTLVQRRKKDVGFPLIFGGVSGVVGLWIAVGAVMSWAISPLLSVMAAACAALFLYNAVTMGQDLWKHLQFNARRLEVSYGLTEVRVTSREGETVLSLEDGLDHELKDWAPRQLGRLLRARALLIEEPWDAPVRFALEWAVWIRFEGDVGSKVLIAVPPDRGPYSFKDRSAVPELNAQGIPVFELWMEKDMAREWHPVVRPGAIRSVGSSPTR